MEHAAQRPASLVVFLVRDVAAPDNGAPARGLVDFLDGDVDHEAVGCGAVPVVLAGLEIDPVAGADFLDGPTFVLAAADALGDADGLAVGVGVPGGAGPRG